MTISCALCWPLSVPLAAATHSLNICSHPAEDGVGSRSPLLLPCSSQGFVSLRGIASSLLCRGKLKRCPAWEAMRPWSCTQKGSHVRVKHLLLVSGNLWHQSGSVLGSHQWQWPHWWLWLHRHHRQVHHAQHRPHHAARNIQRDRLQAL